MKRYFSILVLFITLFPVVAQNRLRFRAMEYNCENLFDTLHDYGKDDHQFLPDGEYGWNSERYWKKQGALARVILDAGGLQPVDIVAFCEVENDSVILDLIHRTRLASLGYEYTMTESRDLRGVDVALIYQPSTFRLVDKNVRSVRYDAGKERPTRDVMHCAGVLPTGDTLDVVVVHFPSRRGGVKATEDYRQRAAAVVRTLADSVISIRRRPAVMVMGDCNDEPRDKSLRYIAAGGFVNLSANARVRPQDLQCNAKLRYVTGTYYYQNEWSRIDNILLNDEAVDRYRVADAQIFAPEYLLEEDRNGFLCPYRMYRGPGYHGGVSDHLPLFLDLWY